MVNYLYTILSPGFAYTENKLFDEVGTHEFQVPVGVFNVSIMACGAQGAQCFSCGVSGGRGGCVNASIGVKPGTTLYVNVGGMGKTAEPSGGFNGGGSCHTGGIVVNYVAGGGGASDVRTEFLYFGSAIIVGGSSVLTGVCSCVF